MNTDNLIQGQNIFRHPLADRFPDTGAPVYSKSASVIAVRADNPGIIETPEGRMTFQAGDYIVTDNPPTHAWPVRQQVFESTYARVGAAQGPKIVDQDISTIGGVTEGLPKGLDQRGLPPQGQPAIPGYAQEAKEAARRAAAAAERSQAIRNGGTRPAPAKAAPKPAAKAPARPAAKR